MHGQTSLTANAADHASNSPVCLSLPVCGKGGAFNRSTVREDKAGQQARAIAEGCADEMVKRMLSRSFYRTYFVPWSAKA
jgi:hypothetical protein